MTEAGKELDINPIDAYLASLERAGYIGIISSHQVVGEKGEFSTAWKAIVMSEAAHLARLDQINAEHEAEHQRQRWAYPGLPYPPFKPLGRLSWQYVEVDNNDLRIHYARTQIGALEGAAYNAFDLAYEAAAEDMITVVQDG